jgi:dTDP-4-dehydrorhamnose 3,5-epimerase-like enzyme
VVRGDQPSELARQADAADEPLLLAARRDSGLHYHERGQDDLFVCLQGMARVVVLDLGDGEAFSEDIGDDNPVALYIPGRHAHGFEALTDLLFCYHVSEEYDPADPDEHEIPWDDPRIRDLWSTRSPILSARDATAS